MQQQQQQCWRHTTHASHAEPAAGEPAVKPEQQHPKQEAEQQQQQQGPAVTSVGQLDLHGGDPEDEEWPAAGVGPAPQQQQQEDQKHGGESGSLAAGLPTLTATTDTLTVPNALGACIEPMARTARPAAVNVKRESIDGSELLILRHCSLVEAAVEPVLAAAAATAHATQATQQPAVHSPPAGSVLLFTQQQQQQQEGSEPHVHKPPATTAAAAGAMQPLSPQRVAVAAVSDHSAAAAVGNCCCVMVPRSIWCECLCAHSCPRPCK